MQDLLRTRMERLLALTSSPNEHEAALAMEKLQELLIRHNLDLADLETRGHAAPTVREKGHDLGKAAFRWKLDLAEVIARHYFCHPLVNRHAKTVVFVGRPDNVDSLLALYRWVIEQIKTISREERRVHIESTGEHIDPLRWQVNFGIGVVERLGQRLEEIKRRQAEDTQIQALVVHHESEISDYLEGTYGFRADGQKTRAQREHEEQVRERIEKRKKFRAECEAAGNMEPYYREYPWDRPLTAAQLEEMAKQAEQERKRQERNERRRTGRHRYHEISDDEYRQLGQASTARTSGRRSADRVNLEPFVEAGSTRQAIDE